MWREGEGVLYSSLEKGVGARGLIGLAFCFVEGIVGGSVWVFFVLDVYQSDSVY